MPDDVKDRDAFLQELLRQGSPQAADALLQERLDQLDEPFLEALGSIAQQALQEGEIDRAWSAARAGRRAASILERPLYEISFDPLLATATFARGERDEARQILRESLERTGRLLRESAAAALVTRHISTSQLLAQLYFEDGFHAEAREILREARRVAHEARSLPGEIAVNLGLALVATQEKDIPSARKYALRVSKLYQQVESEGDARRLLPDARDVLPILYQIAIHLYYEEEDFSSALALAETLRHLAPDIPEIVSFLGQCLLRLERFAEAVPVCRRAVELAPEIPSHRANLAGALAGEGHLEESILAITEAIRLRPESVRYHLARGQYLQSAGQHERAIADFDRVIDLAAASPSEEPAEASRSQFQYERNMPVRDMADFARMAKTSSLLALGQDLQALDEAEEMIASGDRATHLGGYLQKSEILIQTGRSQEAIAALSRALELTPRDTSTLLRRSQVYQAVGELDRAISDLAQVADRRLDPEAAIQRLSAILEENPGHAQALKWRGFAYFELGRASLAVQDLTQARQELDHDAQIHLWLGLARITSNAYPEEQEWIDSFSRTRCIEAVLDLSLAAQLNPADGQALAAYTWLVDLSSADSQVRAWLRFTAKMSLGLYERVPLARDPIEKESQAADLSSNRKWAQAVPLLLEAQEGYRRAGLLATAARVHLSLADNYLRLNELQLTLDHLDQVEKTWDVHMRPLTHHLQGMVEGMRQKQAALGRGAVFMEIDYLGVYGIGSGFIQTFQLLKAQTLARLGDHENSVKALGDLDTLFEKLGSMLHHELNFQAMVAVAQILRDADRDKQALEWLEKLQPLANSDLDKLVLKGTQGTLFDKARAHEDSVRAFREAYEIARGSRPEALGSVSIQLAGALLYADRLEASLEILDTLAKDLESLSERDRLYYWIQRTQVLNLLGRSAEAKELIVQVLDQLDEARSELKQQNLRVSWQMSQEKVFRLGVGVAIRAEDPITALELAERAKARAFVDQLATADVPVPSSAQRNVEIRDTLLRRRQLLADLQTSSALQGASYMDYETVYQLTKIDPELSQLIKSQDGNEEIDLQRLERELSQTEADLRRQEQQIEAALLDSLSARAGRVSSFAEVRTLLGELTPD